MLAAALHRAAAERPGGVAVATGDSVRTVADLAAAAGGVAADLAQRGLGRGVRLSCSDGDPVDLLVSLAAGDAVGATTVVTGPGPAGAVVARLLGALPFPDRAPAQPLGAPAGDGEVVWLGLPTSGTTGSPRAVSRTRRSWEASVAPFSELTGARSGATVLVPGPLHTGLHLFGAVHALAVGASVRCDPVGTDRPWDVAHLVPATLRDVVVAAEAAARPLSGRTAVVAGAALPPRWRDRAAAAGLRVVAYYGSNETSFVAVDVDGDGLLPFPGVEVVVRDGDGRVVLDRPGTIWARSPYLAHAVAGGAGPDEAWRDAEGWASAGDLGVLTRGPRGPVLAVLGRGDAVVLTGGATVVAEEVERVLQSLPGVPDVAVVGLPHPRLDMVLVAVVEADADRPPPSRAHLRAAAASRLAAAWLPRRWYVVPALPRTAAGKVARAAVAAGVANGSLGARPLP